jgi:hypothetical protein
LLDVPEDEPAERVVNVMCTVTDALCDYEATDDWRLTLFLIA